VVSARCALVGKRTRGAEEFRRRVPFQHDRLACLYVDEDTGALPALSAWPTLVHEVQSLHAHTQACAAEAAARQRAVGTSPTPVNLGPTASREGGYSLRKGQRRAFPAGGIHAHLKACRAAEAQDGPAHAHSTLGREDKQALALPQRGQQQVRRSLVASPERANGRSARRNRRFHSRSEDNMQQARRSIARAPRLI